MQIIIENSLISYNIFEGQTSSPVLLFLHGWRSQKEIWNDIIIRLKGECAIYALDLPGFGQSQTPNQVFSVGDYAKVVAEFIKKLELKNVIIIGHSFGGRIGIKLAATHPELISKLVLVDSAGFVTNSSKRKFYRVLAKMAKPLFGFAFMQGLRRRLYQFIGAEDYLATPQLQKTFVQVVNEDLTKEMEKINCPTLIIGGENDKETPFEFGKKMNSLISNSKFVILKNAGHFSFLDKPEEFVKILTDFV